MTSISPLAGALKCGLNRRRHVNINISGGEKEDGAVIGNTYDKYGSRNLLVKRMMGAFEATLSDFVAQASPRSIHEIGCGEGYWVVRWHEQGLAARGCDLSRKVIEIARKNAVARNLPHSLFSACSIYALDAARDSADLVVCCEVLEHLNNPEAGLQALQQVVNRHLILSVPREPLWRALNLVRGRYIANCGNTPGHVQHWSKSGFVRLVSKYFKVLSVKSPLPWTVLLARPLGEATIQHQ